MEVILLSIPHAKSAVCRRPGLQGFGRQINAFGG